MMNKQQRMSKLTVSAISISMLLVLSACSSDDADTESPTAVNETTTSTAVADTPTAESEVAESETAAPESIPEADAAESTVTTEKSEVEASKPEVAAEPEVLAADAGAKLYESNCKVCHEAGLLNAPKYGDKAAWAARLSKGKDTLHIHSAKGFKNMPAQVTDKISEAQVYAAVDYMIEAVS
ncbi:MULTISPECIES: c-type cytochrome [unclassified Psychrobacter]|uniref:c-type cytochrome n=1 Tax=unclassified Psychrobacter TaxID=196806 RepID=UPI00178897EF|nr:MULTISPECIES: c-type cytochrome [unclassified Psychrobacter]MBE0442368.1 c-type cytochrome [Psychrobacter sp. FME13]